jgi:hypothetical protein
MTYSIQGARNFDLELSRMDRSGIVAWLKTGFDHLDSGEEERIGSAFPPLWLRPESDPFTQLAVALREAEAAKQFAPGRIRSAIRVHLTQPGQVQKDSLSDLRRFWQLLGAMGSDPGILKDARIFLGGLDRLQVPINAERDELGEVVGAVVTAVSASRPVTASHSQFFRFLRRHKKLWRTSFVPLLIDTEFELNDRLAASATESGEVLNPLDVWSTLRAELGEDLRDQVNVGSSPGRAMVRSVYRRLHPLDPVSTDREEATRLDAALFDKAARPEGRLFIRLPKPNALPTAVAALMRGDAG